MLRSQPAARPRARSQKLLRLVLGPAFAQQDVMFDPGPLEATWGLGPRATAVVVPGDRQGMVGLGRHMQGSAIDFGLEAVESELSPLTVHPRLRQRMVRRVGPAVKIVLYGGAKKPSWRQLHPGLSVEGRIRLWPGYGSRPSVDGRLQLMALAASRSDWRMPHVWGKVAWRNLTGEKDPIIRAGGWGRVHAFGQSEALRPLAEAIFGYEDVQRYASQLASTHVGLGWRLPAATRIEFFAAATYLDCPEKNHGHLMRAAGAAVRVVARPMGLPVTLAYQVSRRFDHVSGPYLHLVSAVL